MNVTVIKGNVILRQHFATQSTTKCHKRNMKYSEEICLFRSVSKQRNLLTHATSVSFGDSYIDHFKASEMWKMKLLM